VHHIKVAVSGKPQADRLVHHGLHVGGHHWQAEFAATKLYAGIAFGAAFHPALARQQQNVVVVENFHGSKLRRVCVEQWALGLLRSWGADAG
jgi:hypothetical protein